MADSKLSRRRFMLGTAVVGAAGTAAAAAPVHDGELGAPPRDFRGEVPFLEGTADAPPEALGTDFKFFTTDERAFIEAVVDRLIPKSPEGPSGSEADIPFFLDRQLAGLFGRGDHYFLGGPWKKGEPTQGYQMRFSPAQLYRAAIKAINDYSASTYGGAAFVKLSGADQDKVLKGLEAGTIQLSGGVDAKAFFAMLLQNTKEGYFSDPIYGGNKDMAAWKMIGFPGAHYDYSEWVTRHGERVPFPTVGFKGRPGWTQS
jgi:gluconate 2-dehydrogenase gamma chain